MCIKRSHRSYKSITILLPTEAQLDPNVMSFKLSVHDVLFIDNNLEQRERYNCPHCQYLLKDAVQTSCGHWFCLECAKDMFEKNPKPLCPREECREELVYEDGKPFFTDRFVRREINKFLVRCRNHTNDCPWTGVFADMIKHLEICTYEQIECPHCRELFPSAKHEHHVATCSKAMMYCPYKIFGCKLTIEMTRAECDEHLYSEVVAHFKIAADAMQTYFSVGNRKDDTINNSLLKHNLPHNSTSNKDKPIAASRGLSEILPRTVEVDGPPSLPHVIPGAVGNDYKEMASKQEVDILKKMITEKDSKIQHLQEKLQRVEATVQAKSSENEDRDFRLSLMENSNFDGSMVWKIPQFSQRMEDARTGKYTSIFSLPFYSARYGYKMCLRLYILGDGIGKASHMSLFFVLMKGEFDNILQWPFTHKVTFKLINQCGGRDIVDIFQPDPLSSSFQKPKTDMNVASGCPRFVSLNELMQGGFILDDTVYIKVKADTTTMRHP